jgi:hypothetical protein
MLEILLALERSKTSRPLRTDGGANPPRRGCDPATSTVRRMTKGSVRVIERELLEGDWWDWDDMLGCSEAGKLGGEETAFLSGWEFAPDSSAGAMEVICQKMLGQSDSKTRTDPGGSLKARACPSIRLHFITPSSPPTVSRSRNMYVDGPVGESPSSH